MLERERSVFEMNGERIRKAFAMIRRYGTEGHVAPLLHRMAAASMAIRDDSSLTVESLGGAQAIEYLQGQDTERAVRLRRRLILREMFATP